MSVSNKRKIISSIDLLDQPIKFNPFVFSRMFFLWAFLGVIGGIIAGLYWIALELLTHQLAFFTGWQVIPVMTLSGLLAGLIIYFFGDPGEIHLIVNNIRFKNGKLDPKNNPSMILSSLLCVSSGGSLGPEAPLVQVTGSTGSWIGKILRLKGEELRSLSIAGMASGFTALFGAPLGGSLFALEILHHEYAVEYYKAIIPAFVASCFSYLIFAIIVHLGVGPAWHLPTYTMSSKFDFMYAVCFALFATAFGWGFIYCTKFFKMLFKAFSIPVYLKTGTGGLILGIIAYYLPITRYFGHEQINELLSEHHSLNALGIILLLKMIAITVTVTSGWRGGFIIPLFFVGTALGIILHQLFPSVSLSLTIVSCMAAINACVTRTPMSTTILLATLTGFSYLVPIMFASLTGYFFAPKNPFISSQMNEAQAE
jgi:H+/Cl- antiporter ClcA